MCGFEGFVHGIYVQTRFISTLLRPMSFTKNNLVFFRRPFCSSFIQIAFLGKRHCKDMYKLYLRSIVCKSKSGPISVPGLSVQFCQLQDSCFNLHWNLKADEVIAILVLKLPPGFKNLVLVSFLALDNIWQHVSCWPSCADLLFMVNIGKRSVWW